MFVFNSLTLHLYIYEEKLYKNYLYLTSMFVCYGQLNLAVVYLIYLLVKKKCTKML